VCRPHQAGVPPPPGEGVGLEERVGGGGGGGCSAADVRGQVCRPHQATWSVSDAPGFRRPGLPGERERARDESEAAGGEAGGVEGLAFEGASRGVCNSGLKGAR
jgi:hypothetical protein